MLDTHSLTPTLGEISSFERFPRIDSIRICSNYHLFNRSDELEKWNSRSFRMLKPKVHLNIRLRSRSAVLLLSIFDFSKSLL